MVDERAVSSGITERQRQVLELLDRRMPIKLIAMELGVSPSRVNQHIASLKQHTGANDLADLVAIYRAGELGPLPAPSTKHPWTKNHLQTSAPDEHSLERDALAALTLADAQPFVREAPWAKVSEPVVVPGVLDGDHAVFRRLLAMLGMALMLVVTLLVLLAVATAISRLTDGFVFVPVEETESAG